MTAPLPSRACARRVSTSKYTYRPLSFEESIAGYEDAPLAMIVVSTWREWRNWIRYSTAREMAQTALVTLIAVALFALVAFWAAI